jgi:hypothetical protein
VSVMVRDPLTAQVNRLLDALFRPSHANLSSCVLYIDERDNFWASFPLPHTAAIASLSAAGAIVLAVLILGLMKWRKQHALSSSLFFSPLNPTWLRILVVAILVFCLSTFVVVMLGTTGFSTVIFTFNQTEIAPPPLFFFNLPNLVSDAYTAHAWANVIGLSLFGIFWMFARQVLLLFFFCAPSFRRRAPCIDFVDIFGKWVGFFFVEAMLIPVAFRLHVAPVELVSIDLLTSGSAAYFLYILGMFLSVVAGNLAAVMARRAALLEKDRFVMNMHFKERSWLGGHVFVLNNTRVRLKLWTKVLLSLGVVAGLGLTVAAIVMECVAFTLTGLAGRLLPLVGTQYVRSYSILTVVTEYGTIVKHVSWMYVSQVCLFVACVLMPVLCCLSFAVLWFVPLSASARGNITRVVIVLRSWNFLEIFFGALLAATLSISLIGQFLVASNCALINQLLVEYFSVDLGSDTFCYDVATSPLAGFWVMLTAALVTFAAGHVLVLLARATDEEAPVSEDEIGVLMKPRKTTWLDAITEEVNPREFRTDLQ